MRAGAPDSIEAPIDRERLRRLLLAVEGRLARPATIFLVGEASLVLEGWREWTDRVVWAAEAEDEAAVEPAVAEAASALRLHVRREHPREVIPLPPGHEERARPASEWRPAEAAAAPGAARLRVLHFDPCSVTLRLVARGDEPDYHAALALLEHGFVSLEDLDRVLVPLLPHFSNRTLQQDPAEFRRKYKGLRQMWRSRATAIRPPAPVPGSTSTRTP